MGRTKKRHSGNRAAAKRAERELQRQMVQLGLESPPKSPTRQILRPDKARSSANYVVEPQYRQLLDYVVRSGMSQFGLIDYQPPDEMSLGEHFHLEDAIKVLKIAYVQTIYWYPHWKPFFRRYYGYMLANREIYIEHLFKGLLCIHFRDRPFFDNLLGGLSFVLCATVYFSYNGWPEAVFHPFRVLASHFESQLRIPFARSVGFEGLAKFCQNHDMLKMYEYYCERKITKLHQALEKDVKVRVKKEVEKLLEEFEDLLIDNPEKVAREAAIQGTIAWIHHHDMDVRPKRIIGNEWQFKDTLLLSTLLSKRLPEESPEHVPEPVQEEDLGADLREPIVSRDFMNSMRLLLEDFNTKIFELEKRVESLLD